MREKDKGFYWGALPYSYWRKDELPEVQWAEVNYNDLEEDLGLVEDITWDAWESLSVQLEDGRTFRSDNQGESWYLDMTRRERVGLWLSRMKDRIQEWYECLRD